MGEVLAGSGGGKGLGPYPSFKCKSLDCTYLLGHQDHSVGRKGWKAGGQRLRDFAARQALYYKPRRSLSLALARRPTGSGNQLLSRQRKGPGCRRSEPAFCAGSSLGGWSPEEVNSAGTPTSPSRQTMRRVPSCRLSGPSAVTAARAGVGSGPGRTAKLAPAGDSVERLLAPCPLPLPPLPRNPSVAPGYSSRCRISKTSLRENSLRPSPALRKHPNQPRLTPQKKKRKEERSRAPSAQGPAPGSLGEPQVLSGCGARAPVAPQVRAVGLGVPASRPGPAPPRPRASPAPPRPAHRSRARPPRALPARDFLERRAGGPAALSLSLARGAPAGPRGSSPSPAAATPGSGPGVPRVAPAPEPPGGGAPTPCSAARPLQANPGHDPRLPRL
ncbi:hypothetical protein H8959_007261 [Pygathrix nigripes]